MVRVAQPVEHETEDFGEGVRVTPWTYNIIKIIPLREREEGV